MNWHPVRWILVIAGVALAVFAYIKHDAAIAIFAFMIVYQGVMNVGCMKCIYYLQARKQVGSDDSDEITFEEIL